MQIIGATVDYVLRSPKEKVLSILSSPALIVNWHPWIEEIAMHEEQGLSYRRSRLSGGDTELVEKLWREAGTDTFYFESVQGLWAEHRYRSKISVEDAPEGGTKIVWEGRLLKSEVEDEGEQMEQFYKAGLRGLEDLLSELES